jgi:hypothetical protein
VRFRVTKILIGLHRVGIVGLQDALEKADASGLRDREEVVSFLMETLGSQGLGSSNAFPGVDGGGRRGACGRMVGRPGRFGACERVGGAFPTRRMSRSSP